MPATTPDLPAPKCPNVGRLHSNLSRGGVYRYYTCYSRQRHGIARCDQERIPADPLEEAMVAEALATLDDGSILLESRAALVGELVGEWPAKGQAAARLTL